MVIRDLLDQHSAGTVTAAELKAVMTQAWDNKADPIGLPPGITLILGIALIAILYYYTDRTHILSLSIYISVSSCVSVCLSVCLSL